MIQFKKLNPAAEIPARQSDEAAGFDLFATHHETLMRDEQVTVRTGIACALPRGTVGIIKPRSGLAVRNGINIHAGVIDSDYRGEIKAVLINHGTSMVTIKPGDRIAQMVVVPVLLDSMEVDELDETTRGINGFGSTGD